MRKLLTVLVAGGLALGPSPPAFADNARHSSDQAKFTAQRDRGHDRGHDWHGRDNDDRRGDFDRGGHHYRYDDDYYGRGYYRHRYGYYYDPYYYDYYGYYGYPAYQRDLPSRQREG